MSTSRYQEFQSPHLGGCPKDIEDFGKLMDEDGSTLYETEYSGLLRKIIKLNDVAALDRYLTTNTTKGVLGLGDSHLDDPFWIAAAYGSTDALRVLLMHWDAADPSTRLDVPAPDMRGYGLLQTACESAHVETVHFLLDGPWQATYGDIHAINRCGSTALLAAAASFVDSGYPSDRNSHNSIRSYLACAEEVMKLLLDRGASVHDTIIKHHEPDDTVLSLAISGASLALVKRLIDLGADVNVKMTHDFIDSGLYGTFGPDSIKDVIPLHIGSQYSNVGGIQAVLDHARDTEGVNVVQHADSFGRLPLHWAAWGADLELYRFEAEEIVARATATVELLLAADPSTVNAQDMGGCKGTEDTEGTHKRARHTVATRHDVGEAGVYGLLSRFSRLRTLIQNGFRQIHP